MTRYFSMRLIKTFTLFFAFLLGMTQTAWGQSGNWTDYKATGYDSGSGTAADPYIIKTAEQLAYFSARVTSGKDQSAYVYLGASIDLAEHYWIPIGTLTKDGKAFKGVFDGRGYTISNMKVKWHCNGNENGFGLFAWFGSGASSTQRATVRNLIMDKASFEKDATQTTVTKDKGTFIGPLVGGVYKDNTLFENIIILNSEIKHTETFNFGNRWLSIGGLIGKLLESPSNYTFRNIYTDTDIDVSSFTGNKDYINVGGLAAEWQSGADTLPFNVFVTGTIKVQKNIKANDAGAVLGKASSGKNLSDNVYYTSVVTDGAGNAISGALTGGFQKEKSFLSDFVSIVNSYINDNARTDLIDWKLDENTNPSMTPVYFNQEYTTRELYSYVTISGFDTADYTVTWSLDDGIKGEQDQNDPTRYKVPLSNKVLKGTVTLTSKSTSQVITKRFSVTPRYYSEDIYADAFEGGTGTAADPYLIANDLQLAKLARDVNTGNKYDGKYFKLTADINLNQALWMPIGLWYDYNKRFGGKFDGDGHSVNDMHIWWEAKTGKWVYWGLFAYIKGTEDKQEKYAVITNLIVDNALLECKPDFATTGSGVNLGVVLGELAQYSEISNIIVRNSTITDNDLVYTMSFEPRMGGLLGNAENSGNCQYRIYNLSSDTKINVFKNASTSSKNVSLGGVIGRMDYKPNYTAPHIPPTNLYFHGPDFDIDPKTNANFKYGPVLGRFNNANTTIDEDKCYYLLSPTNATNTSGTKLSIGEASNFQSYTNAYLNENNLDDKKMWSCEYNAENTKITFSFGSILLTGETKAQFTITAAEGTYEWYLSSDNATWSKVTSGISEGTNVVEIPYQEYIQYVYATSITSMSKILEIPALRIESVKLDHVSQSTDYSVSIKNSIWGDDNSNLTITYAWYEDYDPINASNTVLGSGNTFTYEGGSTNPKISCHVTVKYGDAILADKWVGGLRVIYLCPAGVTIGETTYNAGNDTNDGLTPGKAKLTWQGAYAALNAEGSWDENKIVLMGTSSSAATFNTTNGNLGFAILANLTGNGASGKYDDWKKAVENSKLNRNTTISGKHGDVDYQGVIEMKQSSINTTNGDQGGLGIFGDTRFEHITFQHKDGNYDIFYCQYNSLEMGEGVVMKGYGNGPGYGTLDGATTMSFQVFGGLNNDSRFYPLNTAALIKAMEDAMPHGKEGFTMTFKSGHYSTICAGGRQNQGNLNGVMGTANMPVKCTIIMDIDRATNDATGNNDLGAHYDAGIIMAGNHEGAMFGDVDIIIRSGKVGRVVNGTLGAFRDTNGNINAPYNTYMGRASITLDPRKDENGKPIHSDIVVTELYGGSCGRGFTNANIIDNPFYGHAKVTINGGTFQYLGTGKGDNLQKGIFGAGAGGRNGIGYGTTGDGTLTTDDRIGYWATASDGQYMKFGNYATAKSNLLTYKCYNADTHTDTEISPLDTKIEMIINDGLFGSSDKPIDGVYGGGSGYMAPGLWTEGKQAIPSTYGGNIYGQEGQTVVSLTINGGEFYCKEGIFAGGRGTDYYYKGNCYGATDASAYDKLGKIYGNVEMNINGGTFHCPVFGGGYGVADAKLKNTTTVSTLSDMALITGRSIVRINGGTFYNNVYGGGDMARINAGEGKEATYLEVNSGADIRGAVFAGGNGRENRNGAAYVKGDDKTDHPELVGKVSGNTNVSFFGSTQNAPYIYGDIFGGGNLAKVDGNTSVNIYAGNFAGQIFGGGNGKLIDNAVLNSADVTGNTSVLLAQDLGGQEEGEEGTLEDQFSINVIWNKLWNGTDFVTWENSLASFYDNGVFKNPHNIYGGGNLACNVTGTATVTVQKGMTPYSLLKTTEWKKAYNDNKNPHFYVFGGGYGKNTTVGNTDVTVNVQGEYGEYSAEVDDPDIQMSRPSVLAESSATSSLPVFDNSKGIPNFTVLGVLGGGYAGTVSNDTKVTVDGMTFLHRIYGGGFGDPNDTDAAKTTGQVGGNTEVYVMGAHTYGDVFGGGAGVSPNTDVARVKGTTRVEISDDARIYGSVYGGGDIACVGTASTKDYNKWPTSSSTHNNDGTWTYNEPTADYATFVNIIGGDIFGEVYGGGRGVKQSESTSYADLGRIEGNTLVHIANTPAEGGGFATSPDGSEVTPYVWNRIYGGCAYGTVDGNAFVHVEGGMLGLNIFGGGYGDVPIENDATNSSEGVSTASSTLKQVLGKKHTSGVTSADILGNTRVQIDGGSWVWNRKADTNGNITTWTDADRQVLADFDAFKAFDEKYKTTDDITTLNELQGIDPSFFSLETMKFVKNHNIFGGGNRACKVIGNAEVILNHSPVTKVMKDDGTEINILDFTTQAGLCWYMAFGNSQDPQFSVFGAGYGANTTVGTATVKAQPGFKLNDACTVEETNKYLYRAYEEDYQSYVDYETELRQRYDNVTPEQKKIYYGSRNGDDSDPKTYLRYRSTGLAWSEGIPNFTFIDIHGGGFSGEVTGDATVTTDNQLTCRNIFGGGLGAVPYGEQEGTEAFGVVGGNATVKVTSAIVSQDIFGGGAGVESIKKSDRYVDFPNMAQVKGKTYVEINGTPMTHETERYILDRTLIFGSVFGGGDVAVVGTSDTTPDIPYTSEVVIKSGTLFAQVYAGGNGRKASECADYQKLGAIYGDTRLKVEKTGDVNPYLFNRLYGGGKNGKVVGSTHVDIAGGNLFFNVFGGGWGDVSEDGKVTSADVSGNTNIVVSDGNICLTSYWLPEERMWEPATILGSVTYSPQYDPFTQKFKINHNIYGGGNLACKVVGSSNITMTKGLIHKTTPTVFAADAADYNFFHTNEWKEVYEKVGSPHFAVFGGGYGENTSVGSTNVKVTMVDLTTENIAELTPPTKGEEYKHCISGQTVMDIVGGGYSGKVEGETNVTVGGGTFSRRIFGGGFYNSVLSTKIQVDAVDCRDIYGGGLMGDVLKRTKVYIGSATGDNKDIYIHGNVYGGNDVSGYINLIDKSAGEDVEFKDNEEAGDNVGDTDFTANDYNNGTFIKIRGGHIYGNVYGAGNGDYLYALGKNGETQVTVNEDYQIAGSTDIYDLVYTVPMRGTMVSPQSASPAMTIVNINSWRPLTNKVTIDLAGTAAHPLTIDGNVFGGGNSATVLTAQDDAGKMVGGVNFHIGDNIKVGGIYLGSDGDQLFMTAAENPFLKNFQDINKLSLHDAIDWLNDPCNHGISTAYLPTSHENRPAVYPHLLDLYFQPVEMAVQPTVEWKYGEGTAFKNVTIGTFCCGGNRGNMNVEPKTDGNIIDITFPKGLTITEKIVGGCNQANYTYEENGEKTIHVGGYLLGKRGTAKPLIKLTVLNDFTPSTVETSYYKGANVYGGCYDSGTIKGDVTVDFRSNMLKGLDKTMLEASNDAGIAACNVYGAGYGTLSYVRGNIKVYFGSQKDESSTSTVSTSANFLFGGGQQGNVVGNTTVHILNGHLYKSVTGGSYAGFQWGSTQVLVGYPSYYVAKKSGTYNLLRADTSADNLSLTNSDESNYEDAAKQEKTIKQTINILKGDIVSEQVYDAIQAYDKKNSTSQATEENFGKQTEKPAGHGLTWNDVKIDIDEAIYGGGYSLATGSSVLANNTTVLKYTETYNIDNTTDPEDLPLQSGINTSQGFGGNTTMLIADHPAAEDSETGYTDQEHISISHQEMQPVTLPANTDLFGYYYKDKAGNYRYIYQSGTYYMNAPKPHLPEDAADDSKVYEYDGEGGVFGDGHLSYAQGFRNAEVTGYGYANHSPYNAKIINTFQRMDMLRLTDNCLVLLGARDYATNATNKTPYSIARVGEIQMISNINGENALPTETTTKTENETTTTTYNSRYRNYMGLSNNIHYVGAISSNVAFSALWHDDTGALGKKTTENEITKDFAGKSYQEVKQFYIDKYYKEPDHTKRSLTEFQKRNDGTAKNMIGISSGYALKIQNAREVYDQNELKIKDELYYGPIVGVVQMYLIDVRQDEGGGYVYADNVHKRTAADGSDEDFLETTGNFVFPYSQMEGQYIVDDCFPSSYDSRDSMTPEKNAEIHYWYVTGFNYFYNVHITGYTYNSKENPLNFDSDNTDGLTVLAGLKEGQEVDIISWKRRSGHPDDYSCDLEERNYDNTATDNSGNKLYNPEIKDENGSEYHAYTLKVGGSNGKTYNEDGVHFVLPMNQDISQDQMMTGTLPQLIAGDAKIAFRLTDAAVNTSSEYYNAHLKEPCLATLVLRAPWMEKKDESGNPTTELKQQKGYIGIQYFYTRSGDEGNYKYTLVTSGTWDTNKTYFYYDSVLGQYVQLDGKAMYTKNGDDFAPITDLATTINFGGNQKYYYYTNRYYTYTIYLTIEYAQGPDVSGNITINNCALPGEMIKLSTENVKIDVDQSMSPNGYYWRIGRLDKDGKFEAKQGDTTTDNWVYKEADKTSYNIGYDTYRVGDDATKTGVFKGCIYDETENALYIPAYYYMNGYGVQFGFTVNGLEPLFEVTMKPEDRLLVHNYHRMSPHSGIKTVNLHLPHAVARAKGETSFAEPRIYLSDEEDFNAFVAYLDSIGSGRTVGSTSVKIGTETLTVPRYGENTQFEILQNMVIPEAYNSASFTDGITFAGTLHGGGHVLSGLKTNGVLFNTNKGDIYNLGMLSGRIAGNNDNGKYHCCFEYDDGTSAPRKVYRMDGTQVTSYTQEDFRYGRVAYDLNEYYLKARQVLAGGEDNVPSKLSEKIALKYVLDYYANGDYQYAHRRDADTRLTTGIEYLRTGNGETPGYGTIDTHHDMSHPIDKARAQGYQAATESDPETRTGNYLPLFNAAAQTGGLALTEPMNDYIFWGQSLQAKPEGYPSNIVSRQLSAMTNRVWRAVDYISNVTPHGYHHNAFKEGDKAMSTYVHTPKTTAVDFACMADGASYQEGEVGGVFYPPYRDVATKYNAFVPGDATTRNLIVYTPADKEVADEAYDVVNKALGYNEETKESTIRGHHVTVDGANIQTQYLHLVERATMAEPNNDFCVPTSFNVTDRAWYTRKPTNYAEIANSAWDGICLPFTANKVVASINGEITHFYGNSTEEEKADPAKDMHTLHHEYWLRGLTNVAKTDNITKATFARPGVFTDTKQTTVCHIFQTDFFEDTYGERGYDFTDPTKEWYAKSKIHTFADYLPLTAQVPYLVSFPGTRFYEFDLSSVFYQKVVPGAAPQSITYNAYGPQRPDVRNYASSITIPVMGDMKTDVSTFSHIGTFMATDIEGYTLNTSGSAFEESSEMVLPFRTYMQKTGTANSRAADTSIIYIYGESSADDEIGEDNAMTAEGIRVYPAGKGRITVESTYATTLSVYTVAGQLFRVLDIREGEQTFSGFHPGIYVVAKKKIRVM